jgi:polar amino acid transport system substrate-binding protein
MHGAVRRTLIALVIFCVSCNNLPRDPHKTMDHVVRGRVMTVGVAEDDPFLVRRGEEAVGVEADLIKGFASQLGATVKWQWRSQESLLQDLSEYKIDLVAGGLSSKTPWKKSVAVTRPFAADHVFAVPPGENAFLSALERYLAAHRPKVQP